MPKPSGPSWVPLFPDSKSIGDLKGSFAADVKKFLSALSKAGARVTVISTLRPPKQQYLMYWSFQIAKNSVDPTKARPMAGVDIDWVHKDPKGAPDIKASRKAASEMVAAFHIRGNHVAEFSNHSKGLAVDMRISWSGDLKITGNDGKEVTIKSSPRSELNKDLHKVGAGYGVIKFVGTGDPEHWSADGH
jgi:D-alanyl-D-alanine dipeptidase